MCSPDVVAKVYAAISRRTLLRSIGAAGAIAVAGTLPRSSAAGDPDAQLMVDDLTAWENANGAIPAGAFVAMHSGWEARLVDPASFIYFDADNVPHFPGFHPRIDHVHH